MSKITIYFPYFLESVCNVLKIASWPVFQYPDVSEIEKKISRNLDQHISRN